LITVAQTYNSISGSASASNTLAVQMDYKSGRDLPTTIPDVVYNSTVTGCRVYSASSYPSFNVPTYLYQNQQYSNIVYSNTWDITDTSISYTLPSNGVTVTIDAANELQLTNGVFTTRANPDAYHDYRPTFYYEGTSVQNNTLDYSGITTSGYRYATFAWNIPTAGEYFSLVFTLNGTTSTLSTTVPIPNFQLYYRLEQNSSPFPTNSSSYSSIWADGNSLSGTPSGSPPFVNGNYWGNGTAVPDVVYTGFVSNGTNPTPSSFSIPVFLPTLRSGRSSDIRLYCRIGLSMDTNFGFSNVFATLS
jgi:hypothetical protein